MSNRDLLVQSVADMLSAAYLRGRFDASHNDREPTDREERLLEAAALHDSESWEAAARVAVGDAMLAIPHQRTFGGSVG